MSDAGFKRRLKKCISTKMRCNTLDFILFRLNTSLYTLSLLSSFASELNLTLYITFNDLSDGEPVRGFALGRNFVPGHVITHYETYQFMYLKEANLVLPPSLSQNPPTWNITNPPHIVDFPCLESVLRTLDNNGLHVISKWMPNELISLVKDFLVSPGQHLISRLPVKIVDLVNEFLACPGRRREFSTSLWSFLCDATIVEITTPEVSQKLHDDLVSDTESTHRTNYKTRRHKLFSETNGHAYFWDDLRRHPPFISKRFPPSLLQLRTLLESVFPQIRLSPSVLTSEYRKICEYLSLHRDIALRKYLRRAEFVILFFLGAMRMLKVVPNVRNGSPFSRHIACETSKYVVLTPLGNEIFLHGKLPGTDPTSTHALTLAFRQTAHILELSPLYPLLRQYFPNISPSTNPAIYRLGECMF